MEAAPVLDPVVVRSLQLGLLLLWASAVVHKARDFAAFRAAIEGYALLPTAAVPVFAAAFVGVEAAIAAGLALPGAAAPAALASAALLGVYALAMGANLARGRRDIDCGCAGPASGRIGVGLVARNAALGLASLGAASPAAAREWTTVDVATCALAVTTATALWWGAGELAAVSSRGVGRPGRIFR